MVHLWPGLQGASAQQRVDKIFGRPVRVTSRHVAPEDRIGPSDGADHVRVVACEALGSLDKGHDAIRQNKQVAISEKLHETIGHDCELTGPGQASEICRGVPPLVEPAGQGTIPPLLAEHAGEAMLGGSMKSGRSARTPTSKTPCNV